MLLMPNMMPWSNQRFCTASDFWGCTQTASVHHGSVSKWGLCPTQSFVHMGFQPIDGFCPTMVYCQILDFMHPVAFAQHWSLSKWGLCTSYGFCLSLVFVQMGCLPRMGLLPLDFDKLCPFGACSQHGFSPKKLDSVAFIIPYLHFPDFEKMCCRFLQICNLVCNFISIKCCYQH